MAGRRENPLDPDGGPVGEFAADLRQLRSRAGLTYRRMAPLALASATSLADAASGKSLPTQSVTEGYVRACGGTEEDVRAWTARWHALREQLSLPAPPPEATAEPATRWLPWRRWVLAAIAAAIVVALSVTAVVAWDPTELGELHLRRDTVPPSVELSDVGLVDWVHWGYLASDDATPDRFVGHPVPVDCRYNLHCSHRKRLPGLISDYMPIGNVEPFRLRDRTSPVSYSWRDGTPTADLNGVRAGEYMGLRGNGFRITVPAGRIAQTFVLYAGVYQGKAQYRAMLSDASTPAVVDTSFDTFGTFDEGRFTAFILTFSATHDRQTLTVELTLDEDIGGGNVTLFAAALR